MNSTNCILCHLFEMDLLSALFVFWRSGSVFVVDLGDFDVWLAWLVVVWLVELVVMRIT